MGRDGPFLAQGRHTPVLVDCNDPVGYPMFSRRNAYHRSQRHSRCAFLWVILDINAFSGKNSLKPLVPVIRVPDDVAITINGKPHCRLNTRSRFLMRNTVGIGSRAVTSHTDAVIACLHVHTLATAATIARDNNRVFRRAGTGHVDTILALYADTHIRPPIGVYTENIAAHRRRINPAAIPTFTIRRHRRTRRRLVNRNTRLLDSDDTAVSDNNLIVDAVFGNIYKTRRRVLYAPARVLRKRPAPRKAETPCRARCFGLFGLDYLVTCRYMPRNTIGIVTHNPFPKFILIAPCILCLATETAASRSICLNV